MSKKKSSTKKGEGRPDLLIGQQDPSKTGPIFTDFDEAAGSFLESYANLVSKGFPPSTIALAMLGATLNTYKMFELDDDLPNTLRALADQLENESSEN